METAKVVVEGPVYQTGQDPPTSKVTIEVSARGFFIVHGAMFAYSGWALYHTFKALHKLNQEV
jgi:hypothetical protein